MLGSPNWRNRTLFIGDNLDVLRRMTDESVDMIYLDPPFMSNRRHEKVVAGETVGFDDKWPAKDVDKECAKDVRTACPAAYAVMRASASAHSDSMTSYLTMMAIRLLEFRRVLKPTANMYLHCDDVAGHYLKVLTDAVFGKSNFKNNIVWCYSRGARGAKAVAKHFPRNHDDILLYAKDRKRARHNTVREHREYSQTRPPSHIRKGEDGRWFKCAPRGDYTDASIERLRREGRIHVGKNGKIAVKYHLEARNGRVVEPVVVGSVWHIPDMMHTSKSERVGYPTQKPLALLARIVEASTDPDVVILDPFCGSGTTLVAAEQSGRRWVGIDLSPTAVRLAKDRLEKAGANGVSLVPEI